MAAPTTTPSFLDILRRSNLLTEAKLADYLKTVPNADALSPTALAGRLVRDALLTQFQANHLLKGRYKNFFIGKFKVLEPLGSGGMSQVFLCEHALMRHRVALKMLPIKDSTDPAAVTRFLREARAAAAVNHPNVVRAHDFDQAEGKFYYLIMDYVDGVNLHDLVAARGPLPPAGAANYIAQTAAGLQHIFENGLIHRDLKPSNLLLDRAGVVRILDLGLARFTEDDTDNITRQFQDNAVMGTADYLAPEQALMADGVDIRADIYSLGATFYFLLTGKAPFEGSGVTQKLMAHQVREPEEPAGVPAALWTVLKTMMAKKPDDRFRTPADIIDALAGWLDEPLPPPDEALFPRRSGAAGVGTDGPRTATPPSTTPGPKAAPATRIGSNTPLPRGGGAGGALADVLMARDSQMSRPALTPLAANIPRRNWGLAAAFAAGMAIIAAVAIALVNPFRAAPAPSAFPAAGPDTAATSQRPAAPPAAAPDAPPPPANSLVVSVNGPFRTVAAALHNATEGSRIVITNAVHTEPPLVVENPPPNVRVAGWPETRPVRWKPAAGTPVEAAVRVSNAAGFTLSNVAFECNGRCGTAVAFEGPCPGSGLDGVTVAGCRSAGVTVTGGRGETGRDLTLRALRTSDVPCGVRLITAEEANPTRHVLFERCRFEGMSRVGVELVGPVGKTTVKETRFVGVSDGIRLSGRAGTNLNLAVKNCAFTGGSSGLYAAAVPHPDSEIAVTDSLFYRTGRIFRFATVPEVPKGPGRAWVWHDGDSGAGALYLRGSVRLGPAPADAVLDVGCVGRFTVWLNGTKIGAQTTPYFTNRVYAFPVHGALKAGENVIAVECVPDAEYGQVGSHGMTVRLWQKGVSAPLATADGTWRSSAAAAEDWRVAGFAAAGWNGVKVLDDSSPNSPWAGAVWDSAVPAAYARDTLPKFTVGGNVHDATTRDGYPSAGSVLVKDIRLAGTDPQDDATFFLTPRTDSRLCTLGKNGGPVGVPVK